jgi:hypothetical protein
MIKKTKEASLLLLSKSGLIKGISSPLQTWQEQRQWSPCAWSLAQPIFISSKWLTSAADIQV